MGCRLPQHLPVSQSTFLLNKTCSYIVQYVLLDERFGKYRTGLTKVFILADRKIKASYLKGDLNNTQAYMNPEEGWGTKSLALKC